MKTRKRSVTTEQYGRYSPNPIDPLVPDVIESTIWKDDWSDTRADGGSAGSWKSLIRNEQSATTVLWGEKLTVTVRPVVNGSVKFAVMHPYTGVWYDGHSDFSGVSSDCVPISGALAQPSLQTQKADAIATGKWFRKLRELRQAWQSGVFLGELGQFRRMLRNPAKALFDSAKRDYLNQLEKHRERIYRRYKAPQRRREEWAKAISGTYLEWVYGLNPTISDLEDASSAYQRISANEPIRRHVFNSVGVDGALIREMVTTGYFPGHTSVPYKGRQVTRELLKVKYRTLYRREVSDLGPYTRFVEAQELLGLTLRDFIPTAWNLLPWSFLVDYFANVSQILEAYMTVTEDVRWVNKTIRRVVALEALSQMDHASIQSYYTRPNRYRYISSSGSNDCSLLIQRVRFDRSADAPAYPALEFELPGKPQRWLNMAALFHQANNLSHQNFHFSFRR